MGSGLYSTNPGCRGLPRIRHPLSVGADKEEKPTKVAMSM